MRICVPTETNEGKKAQVNEHFGSAPYFTIIDTETDSVDVIDNSNQHHSHGMCQPMQSLEGKNIDVVVTGGMGARAVQRLNEGGIKVFRAVPGTVEDIVIQFKSHQLVEITVEDACGHHGCH